MVTHPVKKIIKTNAGIINNYKPISFGFHNNLESINEINGKNYELTFKNIMMVNEFIKIKEFNKAMIILDCENLQELDNVMGIINSSRFGDSEKEDVFDMALRTGQITEAEYKTLKEYTKKFDYYADSDAIFYDFLKMGIDLFESDINWFKFQTIFNQLIFDKNSAIYNRIKIRSFEPKKGKEYTEYNKNGNDLKDIYALTPQIKQEELTLMESIGGGKNGK